MKRYLTVAVVLGVVLSMVLAFAGCGGGDTGQAQEYMRAGDSAMDAVMEEGSELESALESLFSSMAAGEITSSAAYAEAATEVEEISETMLENAEKAKAEYEKIKALSGVEDYVKYADLMLQVIDNGEEVIEKTLALIEDVGKMLQQVEAGQAVDETTVMSQMQEAAEEISDLGDQTDELMEEAEKLKTDKNL